MSTNVRERRYRIVSGGGGLNDVDISNVENDRTVFKMYDFRPYVETSVRNKWSKRKGALLQVSASGLADRRRMAVLRTWDVNNPGRNIHGDVIT